MAVTMADLQARFNRPKPTLADHLRRLDIRALEKGRRGHPSQYPDDAVDLLAESLKDSKPIHRRRRSHGAPPPSGGSGCRSADVANV